MKEKFSLVFDIGTSSVKAGLFFFSDKNPVIVRVPLPVEEAFFAGWSPFYWHKAVSLSIQRLFQESGCDASGIAAICVSGNGPSVVAVDNDGQPVGDAVLWTTLSSDFRKNCDSYFLALFRQVKSSLGDRFAEVSCLLSVAEYISFLFCGESACFISHQGMLPLYWALGDSEFSEFREVLPPFLETGQLLGHTFSKGKGLFDLPVGIPVFAGGADYAMAIYGTGAVSPGVLCDRAGTSEGLNYCAKAGVLGDGLTVNPHPCAPYENHSAVLSSSGPLFEWFRRSFGLDHLDYNEMIESVRVLEPRLTPLFFPSLGSGGGREFHSGCFAGLHPEFGAREMGRGVLQSIGFEVRSVVTKIESAGLSIDRFVLCGGQARSGAWNQMKADICGHSLLVPSVLDAELAGCHYVVLYGLGEYSSVSECSLDQVGYVNEIFPDRERGLLYSDLYGRYRKLLEKASSFDSIINEGD